MRRALGAGFSDPRVRLIPVLHVRAAARLIADEFAGAPATTVGTLLVLAGCVIYGAWRIVAVAHGSGRNAWLIVGGSLGLVASAHAGRGDRGLLERVGISLPVLFAVEYALLLFPVALLLAWSGRVVAALATLSGAGAIAVSRRSPRRGPPAGVRRRLQLPLPEHAFEWIGSVRRLWLLLVIAAVLALVIAPLGPSSSGPVLGALGVLAYMGVDAYLSPAAEDWSLVHVFRMRPHRFLLRKIVLGARCYLSLALVPFIVLLAVNPTTDRAATGAVALLAGTAAVAGAVLTKYTAFRPGLRAPPLVVTLSMGAWLASLAMAPPLTLLLGFALWRSGAKTVAPYLPSPEDST